MAEQEPTAPVAEQNAAPPGPTSTAAAPADTPAPVHASQAAANKDVKVVLYWLDQSRAQRILWLLEEISIPHTIKIYKRDKDQLAPPELKKVHPLGKSPIIQITSPASGEKPITLVESGLIVEYLIDNFGPWLKPKQYKDGLEGQVGGETEEWMRYKFYLHYAEGSLMPILVLAYIFGLMREKSPFFIRPIAAALTGAVESKFLKPQLKVHLDFLESQLASSPNGGKYLCGPELTGADILLSFPLMSARGGRAGITQQQYPKIWAYADLLEQRDGWKKSCEEVKKLDSGVRIEAGQA